MGETGLGGETRNSVLDMLNLSEAFGRKVDIKGVKFRGEIGAGEIYETSGC